jgi:HD superfamily phosphohydrolase
MPKQFHEIRDPIHVFVRMDSDEREVINSRPFQRLRYIHQLALTYLVYPGATHRRFEHSLGVMELADRVFAVVTRAENVTDAVRDMLPELASGDKLSYWRRVLRMAALCHDVGHLPFSHAAEKELLPEGCTHETLSAALIGSAAMKKLWRRMKVDPSDIIKLALGRKDAPRSMRFSPWEVIPSEIVVGDAFGVDRMDYLLRDSHHAGVAYGRFDHYRLIDTLRIMPSAPPDNEDGSAEPSLGIEEGGLHSAEALLLARYFMYTQLYFHPVRRIYDIHLKDFLQQWLPGGMFATDLETHLNTTDNEVTAAIMNAARDRHSQGHDPARRIACREHFRLVYERHPHDVQVNPNAALAVFQALQDQFGAGRFRHDRHTQKSRATEFPLKLRDGRITSAAAFSQTLGNLPTLAVDHVFADPAVFEKAAKWLATNRSSIIRFQQEVDHG